MKIKCDVLSPLHPKALFRSLQLHTVAKISFCWKKLSFYKFSKNEQKRKSNRNVLIFGWKNGKRNCKRNVFSILPQCDCPLKIGGGRLLSVFFVKDVVYLSFYTLSKCIEIIINSLLLTLLYKFFWVMMERKQEFS